MQTRVTKRGTPFVVPGGTLPAEPDGTQLCPLGPCSRVWQAANSAHADTEHKGPFVGTAAHRAVVQRAGSAGRGGESPRHRTSQPEARERGQRDPSTKISLFPPVSCASGSLHHRLCSTCSSDCSIGTKSARFCALAAPCLQPDRHQGCARIRNPKPGARHRATSAPHPRDVTSG